MDTQGSECDPRVDDNRERGLGLAREKACEEKGVRGLTGEGRDGRKSTAVIVKGIWTDWISSHASQGALSSSSRIPNWKYLLDPRYLDFLFQLDARDA